MFDTTCYCFGYLVELIGNLRDQNHICATGNTCPKCQPARTVSHNFNHNDPVMAVSRTVKAVDRLCSGEAPDNEGEPRAPDAEILRSSRGPLWLEVFGSVE